MRWFKRNREVHGFSSWRTTLLLLAIIIAVAAKLIIFFSAMSK